MFELLFYCLSSLNFKKNMTDFAGFAGAGVEGGWVVKLLALAGITRITQNPDCSLKFNISLRCVKNIKLVPNMCCLKVFQIIFSACAEIFAFAFSKSGLAGL